MKNNQIMADGSDPEPDAGSDLHKMARAIVEEGLTDEMPSTAGSDHSKAVQARYMALYSLIGV